MTSKVYAISNPSAKIALKYGENVSRGILEMENVIGKSLKIIVRQQENVEKAEADLKELNDFLLRPRK